MTKKPSHVKEARSVSSLVKKFGARDTARQLGLGESTVRGIAKRGKVSERSVDTIRAKLPEAKKELVSISNTIKEFRKVVDRFSQAEIARVTGTPSSSVSDLYRKGIRSGKALDRVEKMIARADKELTQESASILERFKVYGKRGSYEGGQSLAAKLSGYSESEIQKLTERLKLTPTKKDRETMEGIIALAEKNAEVVKRGDITRLSPDGKRIVKAHFETWESLDKPREAKRYKILGVDASGNVIAGTSEYKDFNRAMTYYENMVAGKHKASDPKRPENYKDIVSYQIMLID